MLDIELIRKNPDHVKKALSKRGLDVDIDAVIEGDDTLRKLIFDLNNAQAERNQLAKLQSEASRSGIVREDLRTKAIEIKAHITSLEAAKSAAQDRFDELMSAIPNLPDDSVPMGGKEANEVVSITGGKPELGSWAVDHVELSLKHGLIDHERGVKVSGSGFWLYTGLGAALEWALLNFFCQRHYRDGYTFMLPPHLLLPAAGFAAGQFPKFHDDVFHLEATGGGQQRFLLPTAETAILSVYRDEIIEEAQLPIKVFAYSPCYRREGGGPRADERGTVRGHQFNKVEMFQFVKPENAQHALNELVRRAESILEDLGLHFRTVRLAAGDTSAAMALTYDVEVWIPSINSYKEVSSISWASDYQARRAKIRYRPEGGGGNSLIHTLNASGLATSRLFPAILEQLQQEDGSIIVPEPLRAWLGTDRIGR
jgi:seryl-tRNA synthetase